MIINNKLLAVIIGSLLLIVGVSASVYMYYKSKGADKREGIIPYISSVYGNVSINEPYYIIVPIPLNITKNPMFVVDDFYIIEGNASLNYTETKYGVGLWIESSGDFILKAKLKSRSPSQGFVYYSLSVENITKTKSFPQSEFDTDHLFWAYGNFTSANNVLEIRMGAGPDNYCYNHFGRINDTISNGWQKIEGEYMMCYA